MFKLLPEVAPALKLQMGHLFGAVTSQQGPLTNNTFRGYKFGADRAHSCLHFGLYYCHCAVWPPRNNRPDQRRIVPDLHFPSETADAPH